MKITQIAGFLGCGKTTLFLKMTTVSPAAIPLTPLSLALSLGTVIAVVPEAVMLPDVATVEAPKLIEATLRALVEPLMPADSTSDTSVRL